jgi:hypothetical protein
MYAQDHLGVASYMTPDELRAQALYKIGQLMHLLTADIPLKIVGRYHSVKEGCILYTLKERSGEYITCSEDRIRPML